MSRKKSDISRQIKRLVKDLEILADSNPRFKSEVRGIARNYRDARRRETSGCGLLSTYNFFDYFHQYDIVKTKIERYNEGLENNPGQFKLWGNGERN